MKKFLQDMLTEKDNTTADPVRVCGLFGFVIYNFISVYHAFQNCVVFDYVQYASGLAIIIGIISAGITFKYNFEPEHRSERDDRNNQ